MTLFRNIRPATNLKVNFVAEIKEKRNWARHLKRMHANRLPERITNCRPGFWGKESFTREWR